MHIPNQGPRFYRYVERHSGRRNYYLGRSRRIAAKCVENLHFSQMKDIWKVERTFWDSERNFLDSDGK